MQIVLLVAAGKLSFWFKQHLGLIDVLWSHLKMKVRSVKASAMFNKSITGRIMLHNKHKAEQDTSTGW
jgi:hypothetical protein